MLNFNNTTRKKQLIESSLSQLLSTKETIHLKFKKQITLMIKNRRPMKSLPNFIIELIKNSTTKYYKGDELDRIEEFDGK
jgi:hypothetical protein